MSIFEHILFGLMATVVLGAIGLAALYGIFLWMFKDGWH